MNSSKNIVKNQKIKKNHKLKEMRFGIKVQKTLNRIEMLFPISGLIICFLGFIYLFHFQNNDMIAGILDFSIATLSLLVLLFSLINEKLSDNAKYIIMDGLYILLTLVGFLLALIIGMKLKNPSAVGRTLSFVCLFASLIMEMKKVLNHNYERNLQQEKKEQMEIDNLEKSSIMS